MKTFKNILSLKSKFSLQRGMQKLLAPALIISLFSCNNEPPKDVRPADQQSLVKLVKGLRDQISKVDVMDPNRDYLVDQNVKTVKKHIADNLKAQFTGWDARVLDNAKVDPNETAVKLAFGISIDDFNLEETARYKSIIFRQSLSDAQLPLREKLQGLKVGDHVKITGSFISRDKRIDVDPYNEKEFKVSKNILVNPEFRVDVTDVVVVE